MLPLLPQMHKWARIIFVISAPAFAGRRVRGNNEVPVRHAIQNLRNHFLDSLQEAENTVQSLIRHTPIFVQTIL
jgi:hypothetical protein